MKRTRSSACVVFRRENAKIEYLLLHYRYSHWGFTKGIVEKGETERETIKRETKEETGITNIRFFEGFKQRIYYFLKKNGVRYFKEAVFCIAETGERKVTLSFEHIEYKWLEFEDAYNQLSYKNTKRVLKRANSFIQKLI